MDENRMADEEMMAQAAGGSGFENPEEYRYTALQTIRTKGYCLCYGAGLFKVNMRGDGSLEEEFAKRHLMICTPYLKHYAELGGTEYLT